MVDVLLFEELKCMRGLGFFWGAGLPEEQGRESTMHNGVIA